MNDRPLPPPEAVLIRLVREAAGLKLPAVARAAGMSKARWSQVETGYESRPGHYKPVRARDVTLAHMAAAIGLTPERLETEGQRPGAARILREILRQRSDVESSALPGQLAPLSEEELAGWGLTDEQIRAFHTLPPDMQVAFRAWGELGRTANGGDRKRALSSG